MFISVKTLTGFPKPLLYKVPTSWGQVPFEGALVTVPLRNTIVPAIVLEVQHTKPKISFEVREAAEFKTFPDDKSYFPFVKKLANYHHVDIVQFITRIKQFTHQKEKMITDLLKQEDQDHQSVMLTSEQQTVVDYVNSYIKNPEYKPTVLHGVTGSGKTEVYKKIIQECITQNKSVLLLLPEVTLATNFENILRAQLPQDIPILSFHSATSGPHKKDLWRNLMHKKAQLIIGVHLPVLLPLPNLGAIIIDEEHETGYQEKKHPKVNSKEAAILRAQIHGIPLLLGSATPSISTLHNVKIRGWKIFQLTKRFAGAFPKLKIVHLNNKQQRKNFWITDELLASLKEQIKKKQQTLLFLNRRGVSFFVQCKGCSHVFCCESCSVSLTLHADQSLRCHYCNYQIMHPERCTECGDREFLKKGIGTQQIVTILKTLLPELRVGRADLDVTVNRKTWSNTIRAFENQKLDVLVGTQTITKGYHFPNVTLVGIIWADINLNIPFYNAQETTLQQLIQVAGRAGRQHPESKVILQTMSPHTLFNYLSESDYLKFYHKEKEQRELVGYPPFKRFAELEIKHTKEDVAEDDAQKVADLLMNHSELIALGPVPPPVARIKKIFSRKIYLKADSFAPIKKALFELDTIKIKSKISFTPNPLH
jgi:primosomal protein N' (replication factor Y) (superfamily II helicase)